jgi:hypothetical protein
MSRIPLELCFESMKYIDSHADLRALARVCKSFQHEAERLLWREIIALSSDAIDNLCALIGSNPRIASYIVSLDLQGTDVSAHDGSIIMATISAGIKQTINLRHLSLYLSIIEGAYDPNISMVSLHHFECNLPLDDALIDFLKRQPEILRLRLYVPDNNTVVEMPSLPEALRNLRIFEAEISIRIVYSPSFSENIQ